MTIVRVALDVPLSILFDYLIVDNSPIVVGQRVLVPFGKKEIVGIAMELSDHSRLELTRIKPVKSVFSDVPPLTSEILNLLRFCSDYYQHPLGMTVMSALPGRLRELRPINIKQEKSYSLSKLGQNLDLETIPKRKAIQLRILQSLKQSQMNEMQIRKLSTVASLKLFELIELGYITVHVNDNASSNTHSFNCVHTPTDEQKLAIDAVNKQNGYQAYLLQGITGSGKTEVYVHLMQQTLSLHQQVLLLVPEINLTPQLEQYFCSRFPNTEIISLHSGMSDGERISKWLRAQSGQAQIVLGTRLAVFTPMPNLGLILVDEEHDSSFKQQDLLRYSARDVAIFRAKQIGIPIVLGSATPSLESYYNAVKGRYQLLKLNNRAASHAKPPRVRCINISNTQLHDGFSPIMLAALSDRLQKKEQSLVFINRRGYSPVLLCSACGWMSNCAACAGKLVLHLKDRRLCCHHCGYQESVPHACPNCGNTDLQPIGIGTQRVEETLQAHFPDARILRVDRDSTRNKGSWVAMRKQIQDDSVDILVGTQILAKGHDFPNLTLVGVLNPDGGLYSADFRASEQLFTQLSQVAGRAGRADKPGEVLIQTSFPDHPIFKALQVNDFDKWAQILLAEREQAGFPPFVHQALLRAEGKVDDEVYTFLTRAREAAKKLESGVEIYSVTAASMPKRANHFRAQLLIQNNTRKQLHLFLQNWKPILDKIPAKLIRWSIDIDPLDF